MPTTITPANHTPGGVVNIPDGTPYWGSDGQPHTYTNPTYNTTGPGNGVSGSSTTGSGVSLTGKPASGNSAQASGNTPSAAGNANNQSGGNSSGNTPAVYYPQYQNPFGNDAQVKALNDYAKTLEKSITDYANNYYNYMRDNAVQIASTPGGMDAAKAAFEQQISQAISNYKNVIGSAASEVINNPQSGGSGGAAWTPTDWTLPGGGTTDGGATGTGETAPDVPTGDGSTAPQPYQLPEIPGPNPERINRVDTQELRDMLQQLVDLQTEQSNNTIDYSVQRGIDELTRALEDAGKSYQTQRNQVAADEATALDNQALYNEARGDRGGIGAAQYASIQNTAAQNRRAVNDAQVKLGTDTARQIADLRAQGEFEKADQLLSIAQSRMSQLMNLEQWALGTNVSVDEFNSQLQQWVDEYNLDKQKFLSDLELSAAQLTGVFSDMSRTYEAQQALNNSLVSSGNTLLSVGIMPSKQQLQAMGMSESQAREYIAKKTSPLGQLGLI